MLYRVSGGLIGAYIGVPILLLTTTGRRTGRSRTTPLLCLEDGANWVVIASNGGDDRHPAWWLNLKRTPVATIQVKRRTNRVRAREATEGERSRLWPLAVRMYANYEDYQCRTRREIPIVILEPA
ncbi:MAG: nitroreductase family deazaflavin-dependent oxidoreductase [Deltaproteobacteria bacterium]|nr:nitroreductase family deazaflavin-dependent oxidoreductase [Deltaproteobacteria bacterium]